jgi:hypothetical protein
MSAPSQVVSSDRERSRFRARAGITCTSTMRRRLRSSQGQYRSTRSTGCPCLVSISRTTHESRPTSATPPVSPVKPGVSCMESSTASRRPSRLTSFAFGRSPHPDLVVFATFVLARIPPMSARVSRASGSRGGRIVWAGGQPPGPRRRRPVVTSKPATAARGSAASRAAWSAATRRGLDVIDRDLEDLARPVTPAVRRARIALRALVDPGHVRHPRSRRRRSR